MDRTAQITQLLNEASKCGIGDSSALREVIGDYFCLPTSELDSDIELEGDSDSELVVGPAISSSAGVERDSPVASTSTAEEVDYDDDDVEDNVHFLHLTRDLPFASLKNGHDKSCSCDLFCHK